MQNIDKDLLNQAYDRLPDNLRAVFDAEETALTLINIGKKYNLHIDQMGELTTLVHYVLLGFLAPDNFVRELKNTVGISEDEANLITYDLNQQILVKIRKELEELSEQSGEVPAKPDRGLPSVKTTASAPTVFAEKMQGIANQPKKEVAVTAQNSDNDKEKSTTPIRDPYRETI